MGKDRKKNVAVRYYKEKTSKGLACVRIAKASMIPVNMVRMIPLKVRDNLRVEEESTVIMFYLWKTFDGSLEIVDLVMDRVTKHLRISVVNNSREDMIFEKGDIITFVNPIE